MPVIAIDHVNIATERLEETKRFYCDVLGLIEGARPPFEVRGYWLYAGASPVIHLQQAEAAVGASETSAIRHFAFSVSDVADLIRRLDEHNISYRVTHPPGERTRQVFLLDPNNATVELLERVAP